ncbi:MAG TPA: hypothetical protein PKI71_03845 [Candidatus Rifleibacterium sp.]|nr:hypothetical protein [Candidatus Rifleibacterium sp.]
MHSNRRTILAMVIMVQALLSVQIAHAWDCVEAHPTINLLAFEHFVAKFKAGHYGDKFINTTIDNQVNFQGLTFGKAPKFESGTNAKLVNAAHNFSGWLARGGYDADMPEINMGFRHFYDPVYEPHYLTWQNRSFIPKKKSSFASEEAFFASLQYRADDWNPNFEFGLKDRKIKLQPKIFRPQIDAVTWAFEHEENDHNWLQAKLAYKAAMENNTAAFGNLSRSQMFGKAFRAVGETMHLMADMAQPAHTRADSHSLFEPIEMNVKEKMIRKIMGDRHKNPDFKPVPEFEIASDIELPELMKNLAAFTNRHFFSNDTIFDYEKWHFPRNKKRPYPSPQLSKLKHEAGIFYAWFETVGWVPMAKETGSPFAKVINDNDKYGRKNPHFNVMPNMAEGQAKVLVPLAIFNCAEVIKAFLPSMSVKFDLAPGANGKYLASGELLHNADYDNEWRDIGAIRFNGPGFIQINKNYVKCEFRDGQLLPIEVELKSGDKVALVVRAGGLITASRKISIP